MTPIKALTSNDEQVCLLTYARTQPAETFAIEAKLTATEMLHLRRTLDLLVEMGTIAVFRLETPLPRSSGLQAVFGVLREDVGFLPLNAADAAARGTCTAVSKPQLLVPIWPFEAAAHAPEVLLASGLFTGVPIVFEALPVQDADLARPLPAVASRFKRWRTAANRGDLLSTIAIPGRDQAFAVFAALGA